MPTARQKNSTRSDDLLLVGSEPVSLETSGSRTGRPPQLQTILNIMCSSMLSTDVALMPKRLAGKVFEKLTRPGHLRLPKPGTFGLGQQLLESASRSLSDKGPRFADLSKALLDLSPSLPWAQSKTGPFASLDFERSHCHAVIFGPGGIEERDDVRIGLTVLAPYTRFPDHTQYQSRAFLALSSMDFCSENGSWLSLKIGDVSYSGAGDCVALRCTTKPLLTIWCNAERR